jgi:hypothetical protein
MAKYLRSCPKCDGYFSDFRTREIMRCAAVLLFLIMTLTSCVPASKSWLPGPQEAFQLEERPKPRASISATLRSCQKGGTGSDSERGLQDNRRRSYVCLGGALLLQSMGMECGCRGVPTTSRRRNRGCPANKVCARCLCSLKFGDFSHSAGGRGEAVQATDFRGYRESDRSASSKINGVQV